MVQKFEWLWLRTFVGGFLSSNEVAKITSVDIELIDKFIWFSLSMIDLLIK